MDNSADKLKQLIKAKITLECCRVLEDRGVSTAELLASDEVMAQQLVRQHLSEDEVDQIVSNVEEELSELAQAMLAQHSHITKK